MSTLLKTCIVFIFIFNYSYSQNHSTYFIGHSLVGNTLPDMLNQLALSKGINYYSKRQIINGSPLKYNWENPEQGENGNYTSDLPTGNYNTLILTEAIPLDNHIMWSDTYIMAHNFYDYFDTYANNGSSYIYETWHCINSGTTIDCAYDNGDAVLWRTRLDQDLSKWEAIADYINNQNSNADTKLIPTGQAMALLYDEIELNNVNGINNISEFYTDDIHLNDMGNYYIACVMYTTLFNMDPVGLTREMNSPNGTPYQTPDAVLANKLQELAIQSVCNYQNNSTGICQTLSIESENLNIDINVTFNSENIQIISNNNNININIKKFSIYNTLGQNIETKNNIKLSNLIIEKPKVDNGIYILIITLNTGEQVSKKIIL